MVDLRLGNDEGIILESELNDVLWMTKDPMRVKKMYLSNKNIYLQCRKSNGLFAKSIEEVVQRPLSDIKIINGQPMVTQGKNERFGACLQIQFVNGTEQFVFNSSPRKNIPNWINEIYKLLVGTEAPQEVRQKSSILGELGIDLDSLGLGGLGNFAANIKSAASSAVQTVSDTARQAVNQSSSVYNNISNQTQANYQTQPQIPTNVEINQPVQANARPSGGFCSNCGGRLDAGARFCPGCGAPLTSSNQAAQTPPPIPSTMPAPIDSPVTSTSANLETRRQEFAGIVLKCPNCGQSLSNTDVVCPSCGHQITGRAASNSVQRLQAELMAIENSRQEKKGLGLLRSMLESESEEDIISQKKATLIGSFPIPNTIEEIAEFVILAAGNINVNISKVSFGNRFGRSGNDPKANERGISDAWVGKLQQAYQKAELMFSDKPVFEKIKDIYIRKMTELNMLKK